MRFEDVPIVVFFVVVYGGLPVLLVWGWWRWARGRDQQRHIASVLSLAGFTTATSSSLLGFGSIVYARAIGGFPFYDPLLLRIYRWGALLSLAGIALSIAGVKRPGVLRWHALALSLWALFFWVLTAAGE